MPAKEAAAADGQPGATAQAQERRVVIVPPGSAPTSQQRLNPSGRAVSLTVPAKDGATYLGDIVLTIGADDRIEFSAQRLLDLLANIVDPAVLTSLQGSVASEETLSPARFEALGILIRYDPQQLVLALEIPAERRATRSLQVSPLDRSQIGEFASPAGFSAYANVRGNLDYLWQGAGNGLQAPIMFLDGAARLGGIVAETEAIWQPGSNGVDFQRLGSRLVYDDERGLARWTAGDLDTIARGFQAAPDIAGLSLFRSYSTLQPQQIARPRGDRRFRLERAATVEVQVNGQIVRRIQLQPGTYDLRDFPFTQGANDIRLAILDDAGRTEILRFNVFLDQSQLAAGLTEFGVYAGVHAPLGPSGPDYTDRFAFSGWVRHGISDLLTLGANVQGDEISRMGGIEAVWATGIGTIGINASLSDINRIGMGHAALVTFQRLFQRAGGRSDSLTAFFETRSRDFAALGALAGNEFDWEAGGGYSHAFSDYVYAGVDGRFSHARNLARDNWNLRGTAGYRISDRLNFTGGLRWEQDSRGRTVSGLLSLNLRIGRYSNARADFDTRFDRARMSFNTIRGQGVGAYNVSADVERSNFGSAANVIGNYYANRAELGLSHFGSFADDFGRSTSQRTSLRVATSLALADGAFSVGRPIYDSFAVVRGHESLRGAKVYLDPSTFGSTANTGGLGTATHPSLGAYAERTLTIDAPAAPAGVDLGQGSFRVFPPYRSGYLLQVGSDYSLTAVGRMVNRDGEPVTLVTGTATELAHPEREGVTVFTNRDGRFGLVGLAPGRWRIEMLDDARSTYVVDVPDNPEGVVSLGELTPSTNGE